MSRAINLAQTYTSACEISENLGAFLHKLYTVWLVIFCGDDIFTISRVMDGIVKI